MWNRFGAVDHGMIQSDGFFDVDKSAPRTNVTENTQIIHGLCLICIVDVVGLYCLMMD